MNAEVKRFIRRNISWLLCAADVDPNKAADLLDSETGQEIIGRIYRRSYDELLEALKTIADESAFIQPRYAEDTDTDYFLRCFKAVKEVARAAIAKAEGRS